MSQTHLDAIRRDLNLVVDQSRWCWSLMWENPGRGLDAERGIVHRAPTPEELYARQQNPDAVDGPVHDFGQGSHRARVAYRAAVRAVGTAAVYLEAIVRGEGLAPSQPCPELDPYTAPSTLAAAATHALTCANHITHPERHTRRLADLRKRLDSAVRGLSPVLDQGAADDIAHREDKPVERGIPKKDRCPTCDYRKRRRKNGQGECSVCEKYRARHDGDERPRYLDGISPIEAQRKRIARGDSYGAA